MYIIIAGCSSYSSILAQELSKSNFDIVLIDKDKASFRKLGLDFVGKTVLGDALRPQVLGEAGVEDADAFLALTGDDNVNIVLAQIARESYKIKKVILVLNNPQKERLCEDKGIEVALKSRILAASIKEKLCL